MLVTIFEISSKVFSFISSMFPFFSEISSSLLRVSENPIIPFCFSVSSTYLVTASLLEFNILKIYNNFLF